MSHLPLPRPPPKGARMPEVPPAREDRQSIGPTPRRRPESAGGFLAGIGEVVPTLIAYVDVRQRLRFCNGAYARRHRLSRHELRRRPLRIVLGEAAFALVEDHVAAALEGRRVQFDREVADAADVSCHFRAVYLPHRSRAGRILGFVAIETELAVGPLPGPSPRFSEEIWTSAHDFWKKTGRRSR